MALAGLDVAGISELLNIIGVTTDSSGISGFTADSTLWNRIFGDSGLLLSVGSASAIALGLFVTTKDKSFLMIPVITGVTFYWGSTLIALVQQKGTYEVFGVIVAIVGIALTIGFIQSCIDYFLGVD